MFGTSGPTCSSTTNSVLGRRPASVLPIAQDWQTSCQCHGPCIGQSDGGLHHFQNPTHLPLRWLIRRSDQLADYLVRGTLFFGFFRFPKSGRRRLVILAPLFG